MFFGSNRRSRISKYVSNSSTCSHEMLPSPPEIQIRKVSLQCLFFNFPGEFWFQLFAWLFTFTPWVTLSFKLHPGESLPIWRTTSISPDRMSTDYGPHQAAICPIQTRNVPIAFAVHLPMTQPCTLKSIFQNQVNSKKTFNQMPDSKECIPPSPLMTRVLQHIQWKYHSIPSPFITEHLLMDRINFINYTATNRIFTRMSSHIGTEMITFLDIMWCQ